MRYIEECMIPSGRSAIDDGQTDVPSKPHTSRFEFGHHFTGPKKPTPLVFQVPQTKPGVVLCVELINPRSKGDRFRAIPCSSLELAKQEAQKMGLVLGNIKSDGTYGLNALFSTKAFRGKRETMTKASCVALFN